MKITLFGTQPYDKESFERIRDAYGFDICYHRSHLNANNVALARGSDAVCIFVNDTADAETIRQLADLNVKLIATGFPWCGFRPTRRMPWPNTPWR